MRRKPEVNETTEQRPTNVTGYIAVTDPRYLVVCANDEFSDG